MPFSYAQYAGNGATTTFSVPFPYLLKSHVKVYTGFNILTGAYTSLLVDGTDYTWTSTTQLQTTAAPANGVTLTVLRDTPDSSQLVPWQDGSNLVADDMNIADLQNLYVVQEQQDRNDAGITQSTAAATAATAATTAANTATSTANTALSTANAATSTANTALSTANAASSNASAAVSTANTASSNASAAVATANAANATAGTASTNASNAVTTANAAAANAATALSTANTASSNASVAVSAANTASSNAAAAVSTANTASTNASNAVTTANTASTNAAAAVSTANAASTTATSAATTANTANNKADQAIAAVSNSINYQLKANVAAIPASPANDTYIEVQDSTGLESFTPLAGLPAGFVGDAGLSVRLRYTSAGSTWNWLNYYANNSDARYLKQAGGTVSGNLAVTGSLSQGGNAVVTTNDSRLSDTRTPTDGTVSTAKIVDGAVTSAKIADGAIVDADINASAEIAKTKISGTAITAADTGTVTSAMIADGTIVNADIDAAAAIDPAKIAGTAVITTDSRLSDTRTPTDGSVTTAKLADGSVTSAKIADGTIVDADISASAAIASSKLASTGVAAGSYGASTAVPVLTVNAQGQITAASTASLPSGIVTTSDTGTVTSAMIADGTIVNADINAAASIAGTKISPNFGSQNIATTGSVSGASLSPTGSSVPSNGAFLPAANTFGVATNGAERVRVTSDGSFSFNSAGTPTIKYYMYGYGTGTSLGDGPAPNADTYYINLYADNPGRGYQTSGRSIGIYGYAFGTGAVSSSAIGVVGYAADASGNSGAIGVYGSTAASTYVNNGPTVGVYGRRPGGGVSTGYGYGVWARTGSSVYGGNVALYVSVDTDGSGHTPAEAVNVYDNNSGSRVAVRFGRTTGTVGTITTTTSATAYNTSSDYRLKENITDLTGALQRLLSLKVHRFNFISTPEATVDGFIAHEVQGVVPEAVTGEKDEVRVETYEVEPSVPPVLDEDGNEVEPGKPPVLGTREVPVYQGIDQSKLVPLLTAALQEAIGEIESLKARVAALEAA